MSFAALRGLAREFQIYVPSIAVLVFMRDLEPTVLVGVYSVSLTHAVRGPEGLEGSFHRVPINLIGATVLSPVQYLSSERQMQTAVLDFGEIAPGWFYIVLRRAAELISRNSHSSETSEAKAYLQGTLCPQYLRAARTGTEPLRACRL